MKIFYYIFPYVRKLAPDKTLEVDLKEIDVASFRANTVSFLDEARRLSDFKSVRVKTSETKSQIYLAVLLVLIPFLLSYFETNNLNRTMDFGTWHNIVGFVLFCLGLVYGVWALIWAFLGLTVSRYTAVGVPDIVKCGASNDPREDLTKEILKSVRIDRGIVNHKVDFVIVTQRYLVMMAVLLMPAMVLLTFVDPVIDLIDAFKNP